MSRMNVSCGMAGGLTTAMLALAVTPAAAQTTSPCQGPGAPLTTETRCVTAIQIPGNGLRSYDISWVNPDRHEYYLGDRSNAGVDIIDTKTLKFKRTIGGFKGVVLNPTTGAVNNNLSGPDGVASHGRWLYVGDGDSTLKVIDLNAAKGREIKQTLSSGGKFRLDELALTSDGKMMLSVNNADSPPFATLYKTNGDAKTSKSKVLGRIVIAAAVVPADGAIEQPAWDPRTERFYVSVPNIASNPPGCTFPAGCSGGLLVIDPENVEFVGGVATIGLFDPATNTGVVALTSCGPNGATVGPHTDILVGCTGANFTAGTTSLIINAKTKAQTPIVGLTGSDEVWFNKGDHRYYTGSNRAAGGAVLGVIDAKTRLVIEKIPQSSGSHSVAADSERNLIFVPQSAAAKLVGVGGDTTTVGAGICGYANDPDHSKGCIAVYRSGVRGDDDDKGDREEDRGTH